MTCNTFEKHVGGAEANSEGQEQLPDYERPETVRVGPVGEVTQGSGPSQLDGDYGPGWTRYR